MDILNAIILGIVEGVTEFLPISSTGHLILFNQWFNFSEEFTKLFDIVIQSGAILAVIIIFWKDLWPSKWSFGELENKWGKILAAFVITAIVGLLFGDIVQEKLFNAYVVAGALIFYGIVLLIIEKRNSKVTKQEISYKDAVIIGLVQSLALVPGTSRSGATIIGLLLLGYARPFAAKFSFLLAVPTLIAASGYSLLKYNNGLSGNEVMLLVIGFLVSLVSAYIVSKWFLSFISKNNFVPFAWYRIVLGVLVLIYFLI